MRNAGIESSYVATYGDDAITQTRILALRTPNLFFAAIRLDADRLGPLLRRGFTIVGLLCASIESPSRFDLLLPPFFGPCHPSRPYPIVPTGKGCFKLLIK